MNKTCGYCKFFAQGKGCSFCENPKQEDKNLKEYLYYNFSCQLFEEGTSESRIEWMKTGTNKYFK